jgi:hypothetical protein
MDDRIPLKLILSLYIHEGIKNASFQFIIIFIFLNSFDMLISKIIFKKIKIKLFSYILKNQTL